jgi:dTDP-4-dehydrorhamnose 3,5-epimerase-like enzyme
MKGQDVPHGWREISLTIRGDERGSLIALERDRSVPFDIARVYYIFDTKEGVTRGHHAHRSLRQLVVATSGSCTLLVDDGLRQERYRLDRPDRGLLIEGLVWREMHDFSSDCVLMVLADKIFDEADYIRDREQFLVEAGALA